VRALITGFDSFLDIAINASGRIAESLDGVTVATAHGPVTVSGRVLPVGFDSAAQSLAEHVAALRPDVLVLLGVARSADYRLETGAIPRITSEHPDMTGLVATGRILGEDRRTTTRPCDALAATLRAAGFDARASDDCGGYVCNSTYFAALGLRTDALFVHLPPAHDPASIATGVAVVQHLLGALSPSGTA
jgi:pyroglutamyl-peptidase